MYESFFHLRARPFTAAPCVETYFPGESIEQTRQTSIRAVERAEGPVLAIGPAGVGKSLLCRLLATYFEQSYHIALLCNTQIGTRKALLQNILFELGLPYRDLDEGELRLSLIDHLRPSDACPHGMLLIIDEAHTLPVRLMEEIRMITNLVRDSQPRVRLVMAGGPRLDERFANPKLESFNQRIAARCYLQSFSRDETQHYVRSQITWSGGTADEIFLEETYLAIHRATDGIPRLINQVCNHALTMACQAGQRHVTAAGLEEAWADLQQLPTPWHETGVVADNAQAVIEFGQLDGDVAETPAQETDGVSIEVHDGAALETLVADGDAAIVEFETYQTTEEPLAPAVVEIDVESTETAGPRMAVAVPDAANPFDTHFEEEEMVVDTPSVLPVHGRSTPLRLATIEDEPDLADDGRAAVLDDTHTSWEQLAVGDEESESEDSPRDEIAYDETINDDLASEPTPGDELTPTAEADSPAIDALAEGDESRNEPAVSEVLESPQSPIPADSAHSFEYTVLEASPGEDLVFDTSGIVPAPTVGWDVGTDEENVQCVTFPQREDTVTDDRDLIDVEDEQVAEDVSCDDTNSTERVRRVEYRELFAQLRRVQ